MRKTRKELRRRADRAVDSYAVATHLLNAGDARFRCAYMWLQGYEAARRDEKKARKRKV